MSIINFETKLETIPENAFDGRTNLDKKYMLMLKKILDEGIVCQNRTGIRTKAIAGYMFEHDMSEGFPLITVKKAFLKAVAVELEGFIKGITSKKWYQERGCNFWNSWSNPNSNDPDDLGVIYGAQWRAFNGDPKCDQLKNVIDKLKNEATADDRRLIISAWNPQQLHEMALPPCHYAIQLIKLGNTLNLIWSMRSSDEVLGFPANLPSYALLLSLICKETGYIPGKVIGMFGNAHIYENQLEPLITKVIPQAIENKLNIKKLPELVIKDTFTSVLEFDALRDIEIVGYEHDPYVKIPVAV